jgi:hypothetical protein
MSQSQASPGRPSSANFPADQTLMKSVGMTRPCSSKIHEWEMHSARKNDAFTTNNTKAAFSSGMGIAP